MTEARERWVEQTILHDPEKKNYGNCMQACVASLLNIPLNDVPHFHHDGCDAVTFWDRVESFVEGLGFVINWGHQYDCLSIASGPTIRGTNHCVVVKEDKVIHDPHPSKAGLKETTHHFSLIPVDPGKK